MSFELAGKRVVVTGAASGIGLEIVRVLATLDARILAADRHPDVEARAREASGGRGRVHGFVGDLSRREGVDALFAEAARVLGGADAFFANAGFAYYEKISGSDWEHAEAIFRTNVIGAIYALERMRELNRGGRWAVAITASSMSRLAIPGYSLYSATKAALDRFADGYRFELDPGGQLTVAYPIATQTGFFGAAGAGVQAPWPTQTPAEVARALVEGVGRGRREVYPSALFRLARWLPGALSAYQRVEARRFRRWLAQQGAGSAG